MNRIHKIKLIVAFAIIYLVWGSTYLAIHFAIESIPPFLMSAVRFIIAGAILFAWFAWKSPHKPTFSDWKKAIFSGVLLIVIANGAIPWAEQYITSGMAALLAATISIWMVVLSWLFTADSRPNQYTIAGVLLGMFGVALLSGVDAGNFSGAAESKWDVLLSAIVLILAAGCWAAGSLYSREIKTAISFLYLLSMQMLSGGVLLFLYALLIGEWQLLSVETISLPSISALIYLITIGTLLTYSAYVWLLKVSTPDKVSTYAFINPIVAVFIGWLWANEPVSLKMLLGSVAILASIFLINFPRLVMKASVITSKLWSLFFSIEEGVGLRKVRSVQNNYRYYPLRLSNSRWLNKNAQQIDLKAFALKPSQQFELQQNFPNLPEANDMIARTWHGTVPTAKADEYVDYIEKTGISDYRNIKGNQGAYIFRREEGNVTHFMVLSFWDSEDSVRQFTGENVEKAQYYPEDKKFLLNFEPNVLHYEVALQPGGKL